MTSRKCPQCGLVNFADAANCKRCAAALAQSGEVSTEISSEESAAAESLRPFNSKVTYIEALGVGVLLTVADFVLRLVSFPNELRRWSFVVLGVIYAVVACCFSASRRVRDWLLALSLSLIYLLLLGLGLRSLLQHNQRYGGMFWSNRFYLSPILLFISIPLAAFFGARLGSKRHWQRFAALLSVFLVALAAVPFTDVKPRPVKEFNYSTDIVAGDSSEFAMRLELRFRLQITDDPMRFRNFPTPPPPDGAGGWNVTVLRKDAAFSPGTNMTMNVDGKEMQNTMWPINRADGSSHIDYSQKQDYRHIVNWRVGPNPGLLFSLANAHYITLTWGNVNVVLPDEQLDSLRTFVRSYVRVLHDEGMLCTNPMCVQGPLNPQQ